MQKPRLLVLFAIFSLGTGFSQSLNDPLSQSTNSQGINSQGQVLDCSDPSLAQTGVCNGQSQNSGNAQSESVNVAGGL
jgi:hypothetical protein